MPTKAEMPHPQFYRYHAQEACSWTDDLPVCHLSGLGYSTNQIYQEDGCRREGHQFEDRSFHFRHDNNTFLYGVFDGHDGSRAANFAAQRIPAEILLGQLNGKTTDEEVKEVLRQAFIAVEKGYFESTDDKLAEKVKLECNLPEGMSLYEAYQKYPESVEKITELNSEIAGGTTVAVSLIYNNTLYVANVGDSRVLLCKTDKDGVLRVVQLSVDHDVKNEDELLRLMQLGLDISQIRQGSLLGNQGNTRCLGNYKVKGGYKEFVILSAATSEPIIAEPEIHGGIPIDDSCRFLLLMSSGLWKSLEEATGTEQVNKELAQMTVDQFGIQSTLTGVSQAVVDKVVRLHHDAYMNSAHSRCQKRKDITLMVRNFNFPLPNAVQTPTTAVRFNPTVTTVSVEARSNSSSEDTADTNTPGGRFVRPYENTVLKRTSLEKECGTCDTVTQTNTVSQTNTSSTESSEMMVEQGSELPLDKDGKIEPYVDFSDFYKAVEEAKQKGLLPTDCVY